VDATFCKTLKKEIGFSCIQDLDYPLNNDSTNWTIMYYFAADNKMTNTAKTFIQNLTKIGSSDELNIIMLYDGNQQSDTKLYYVKKGGGLEELNEKFGWPDEVNIADKNTLSLFCRQMMNAYPAQHYGLMIVSVGAGWQGICPEFGPPLRPYTDISIITMSDFQEALQEITKNGEKRLDVISIVACLAGMIEVASEIKPYANYFVASEEDNPLLQVWPSIDSLWNLKNNTDMTPEEFVKDIINYYMPYDVPLCSVFIRRLFNNLPFPLLHVVTLHTTLSAVNLSKLNEVENSVNDLASLLLLNQENENSRKAVQNARSEVREYGKYSPKNYVLGWPPRRPLYDEISLEILAYDAFIDLYNFAQILYNETENQGVKTACSHIIDSINNVVLAYKTTIEDNSSHGLSIYFPLTRWLYNHFIFSRKIPSPYEEIQFSQNTAWDEFLRGYLRI